MSKKNKHQQRLKQLRYSERMDDKMIHKSASYAISTGFAVAMYSAKTIFKDNASNPQMEKFIIEMLKVWEAISDKKVSVQTILDSVEMECKIKYDLNTGNIINLKSKNATKGNL